MKLTYGIILGLLFAHSAMQTAYDVKTKAEPRKTAVTANGLGSISTMAGNAAAANVTSKSPSEFLAQLHALTDGNFSRVIAPYIGKVGGRATTQHVAYGRSSVHGVALSGNRAMAVRKMSTVIDVYERQPDSNWKVAPSLTENPEFDPYEHVSVGRDIALDGDHLVTVLNVQDRGPEDYFTKSFTGIHERQANGTYRGIAFEEERAVSRVAIKGDTAIIAANKYGNISARILERNIAGQGKEASENNS